MMENSFRLVLRVQLQTSGMFRLESETNSSENHIAIFECELKSPPMLSLTDHTYAEYVLAHRINFSNWVLVDLDNFMRGNPFYNEVLSKEAWQDRFTNTDEGNKKELERNKKLADIVGKYRSLLTKE